MEIVQSIIHWISSFADSSYGGLVLFIIAFIESSFFPVPPDILLIPLALSNPSYSFVYATIATIASVLGGMLGYVIGTKGGKKILKKLISSDKLELVRHYFHKYDVWAVGMAALTPIPYKVFTISAGAFNLNSKRFILTSVLGRGGRFYFIALLIFFLGPGVKFFLDKYFDLAIIIFTVLLIGGFLSFNLLSKKLAKKL